MAKQTGWYYSASDAGLIAHHYRAPLARGEEHLPICGGEEARTLGRDLRHECMRSTRCADCERLLASEAEPLVEAGVAEATEEAASDPGIPRTRKATRRRNPEAEAV